MHMVISERTRQQINKLSERARIYLSQAREEVREGKRFIEYQGLEGIENTGMLGKPYGVDSLIWP